MILACLPPLLTWPPDGNSSIPVVSSSPSLPRPASSVTDEASSSNLTTVTVIHVEASTVTSYEADQPSSDASSSTKSEDPSASTITNSLIHESRYNLTLPTSPRTSTFVPSRAPYPYANGTRTSSICNSTITPVPVVRGSCTGCALAALNPVTTSYQSNLFGNWTSLVVTETILTEFITYQNNGTIDGVLTETKTVNQTKTVNEWITDTAANFNIYLPTPGLELTLEVGPTYVLYTNIFGGPDAQVQVNRTALTARNNATLTQLMPIKSTCQPRVSPLKNFIPTRTVDWDFFIQTFANGSTPSSTAGFSSPVPVPTKLVNFLAQDLDVQHQFQGADINTCTLAGISEVLIGDPNRTFFPPTTTTAAAQSSSKPKVTATSAASFSPPAFSSIPGTNTYLSTTYASTSKHITKQGCLRCDTNAGDRPEKTPKPDPNTNDINDDPAPTKTPDPKNDDTPKSNDQPNNNNDPKTQDQPQNTPQNPQNTPKPDVKTTPSVPDIINSIISSNPYLTKKPAQQPTNTDQTITIGNSVVTVMPQPTKQGQGQTTAPTMVIIGTETVTVGQTTTMNGVPVVVPTAGGGSTIIVGDKTIGINPRITQAPQPVLTIGHNTITANPQGQFVIGTQTLQRGGPLLTLDDHTLTLGPNGKIAIWNSGAGTQTLVSMNGQPAVTFGGSPITAEILGGTTVFVLNGQTLGPGSAVTVDGTTFSLPSGLHGSSIVINGRTTRLVPGLPELTVNNVPITATVASGTTEFVLAEGQTLTPGGQLVVSGTTYSLPVSGRGSTIVVNGATSRLNPTHLPVLPYGGESVTATIASGTTAFIFGPGETLTPGGVVTISGTTISLPASASGSVVVVNGVTSTLDSSSGYSPISAPAIVVDGKTITATTRDGTVEYDISPSTTLFPDGQIVISGTTYSLVGGTALVVNGKTSTLSTSPASNSANTTSGSSSTSERGAGDFIASGIGETSHSRGGGSRGGGGVDKWAESLIIGLAGWLLWLV